MSGTGRRGGFNPLYAGFIAGLAMVLILGMLVKINLDFAAPWSSTHTMTAQVTDVDGISAGSDVRIAGRVVGQITSVSAQGDYSTVTFHIDDSEWPLPRDSSASVRLATLLGQKYLQLTPGSDWAHPYSDNSTITLKSTKPVVDFDQILDTFDKPTRDSLTSLIRTASVAVQGQEGTLQQLLPDLRDLSVHSVAPTGELVSRNAEINNILVNLGTTADQFNKSSNDLAGVIDNMNSITGALAHDQAALEGYIANTDSLNRNTDAVLSGGHAAELNAGFQKLPSFTAQLNQLMTTLVPETYHFAADTSPATGKKIYQDAVDLVFQIGAATSQSNTSGFFLRQYANGADPCGLLGPTCTATTLPVPAPPSGPPLCVGPVCLPLPGGVPPLPLPLPLPTPGLSLPTVPTPIPLPLPTAGPLPTPIPLPIATPTPTPLLCTLGICASQADDRVATPLGVWGWL